MKKANKFVSAAVVAVLGLAVLPLGAAFAATSTDGDANDLDSTAGSVALETDVTAHIEPTITLSVNDAVEMHLAPSSGYVVSKAPATATVWTNNTDGYNLMVESATSTTSLDNSAASATIAATTGTVAAPTALNGNSWGMRVGTTTAVGPNHTTAATTDDTSETDWFGVPATGSPTQIDTSAAATTTTGRATNLGFGTRVDVSKPNGYYTNTVLFTAVANS